MRYLGLAGLRRPAGGAKFCGFERSCNAFFTPKSQAAKSSQALPTYTICAHSLRPNTLCRRRAWPFPSWEEPQVFRRVCVCPPLRLYFSDEPSGHTRGRAGKTENERVGQWAGRGGGWDRAAHLL